MNGQVNGLAYEHNTTFVNHPLNRVIFWNTMYELSEFATNDKEATPSGNYAFESIDYLFDHFQYLWDESADNPEVIENDYYVFGKLKNIDKKNILCNNLESTQFIVLTLDFSSSDQIDEALQKINIFYYIYHEVYFCSSTQFRAQIIIPLFRSLSPENYIAQNLAHRLAEKMGVIDNMSKGFNNSIDLSYFPFLPQYIDSSYFPFLPQGDLHKIYFYVNRGEELLSLDNLPQKSILTEALSAKKVAVNASNSDKNKEIVAAKDIANKVYNARIFFHNGKFYRYLAGVWLIVLKPEIEQKIMVGYYQERESVCYVNSVIRTLQSKVFFKKFPKCQYNVVVLGNCTINLDSLEELEHSYEHYAKNKLDFNYDREATCPIWIEFLGTIWGEDQDYDQKVALLQEYMGLSLTPITKFQKMLWLIGEGSNGKSVILDIVKDLVGSENYSIVPLADITSMFLTSQLRDKLVNIDQDMSKTVARAESMIKKIVAGESLTVQEKNKDPFQMEVFAKLWGAMNCLPETKDYSHGFFRRVMILRFNRIITEDEQDRGLTEKLRGELPGIFNWALEGLERLERIDGFTKPASSKVELDNYKISGNPVAQFHSEHLRVIDTGNSPSKGMLSKKVFDEFEKFCRGQGLTSVSSSEFGKKLAALGIKGSKSGGENYYPVEVVGMEPAIHSRLRRRDANSRGLSEN